MSQCRIAGRRNWLRWSSSIRSGRPASPRRAAISMRSRRVTPFRDTGYRRRRLFMSVRWPWYDATIARHASPHSAASVCLMSGRNPRPLKFNSPCMRLHPCAQHRIKQPPHQRALLKNDVGLEQHVWLKRHLEPIGIDVRPLERRGHAVSRLLEGDRPGSFVAGQDRVRDFCHAAAVGAEFLIGKCIVKYPDLLAGAHESERARRKEQLRLQGRIKRNDYELHMPWISDLADSRLQRGHAPTRRRLDYVSAAPVHLGDALLDQGEIAAQES